MKNTKRPSTKALGNSKITKYKKRKPVDINITILIFALVFIYIVIISWNSFGKKQVGIYEVANSSIVKGGTYTALSLREEETILSTTSGYITYYYKDGTKAAVNDIVCSIGPTKQNYTQVQGMNGESEALTPENISIINALVNNYTFNFNSNDFSEIYNFKYQLESKLFEIYNLSNFISSDDVNNQNIGSISRTNKSGLISYTLNGYEDVTIETISKEIFSEPLRESKYLLSEPSVSPGSKIYNIITSEDWSLLFPVPDKDIPNFTETIDKTITVKFLSNNMTAQAKVSKIERDGSIFAKLDFTTLLPNFINNTFLDIEITYADAHGLKIPNTAIVEKEFYKIPLDCIFNSKGTENLTIDTVNDQGQIIPTLKQIEIYYKTNEYALIATKTIESGKAIGIDSSTEKFIVGEKIVLQGVYSVNKGYTIFRRIERELATDNFTIIKKGSAYGISLFDHIVINAKNVTETEIIY